MKKLIMILNVLIMGTGIINAQGYWLDNNQANSITLEWNKPFFDESANPEDLTFATSVIFITGRYRINEQVSAIVDIPISHLGQKETEFMDEISHTDLGNIYVGAQFNIPIPSNTVKPFIEAGVRINTLKDPDSFDEFGFATGWSSEIDRLEAFIPETWSVPVSMNSFFTLNNRISVKSRLGVSYNMYKGGSFLFSESMENEMYLLYGATGYFRGDLVNAHFGFSGRNHVVGNDPEFGETGAAQIRGGVGVPIKTFTPGLFVRAPLGENYGDMVDWALGLSLDVKF